MTKLDTMIAPRALTAREVAEVIAPQLITYGVAHRAFTFACLWDAQDAGSTGAAETAQAAIATDAETSIKQWLGDCQQDGEPRFYQSAGLTRAINDLLGAAGQLFAAQSADSGVAVLISQLEDRERLLIEKLIDQASK